MLVKGGPGVRGYVMNSIWFESLGPIDAIWQHRSGSPLAQIMACYRQAGQCSLMISKVSVNSSEGNYTITAQYILCCYHITLKITTLRVPPYLPGANELI